MSNMQLRNGIRKRKSADDWRWAALVLATLMLFTHEGWAVRAPAPSLLFADSDGTIAITDLLVEEPASGTYWCALQWNTGYMGLQRGGSGFAKHVHFSVWDPPSGGISTVVYQNPLVQGGRFGGEGTGVVTYYPFDWKEGTTYSFAVEVVPYPGGAEYRGYFVNERREWTLLAAVRRPGATPTLGYASGFLEDFAETPNIRRSGLYGNCRVRRQNGTWHNCNQAFFNASIPLVSQRNFDGDIVGSMFRLETGGGTVNDTAVQTWNPLGAGQRFEESWSPTVPDSFITSPIIVQSPISQSAFAGQDIALSVVAVGANPLFYQWHRNGIPLPGETTPSLQLRGGKPDQSGTYTVMVSNAYSAAPGGGSTATSASADVIIMLDAKTLPTGRTFFDHDANGNLTNVYSWDSSIPALANRAVPVQLGLGEPLNLTAAAVNAGFATYQWFLNDKPLLGQVSDVLHVPEIGLLDQGVYSVSVSNIYGGVHGVIANLTLLPRHEAFAVASDMVLTGDAFITNRSIRLTTPAGPGSGSAWFVRKLFCQNGFTNHFQFRINNPVIGGSDTFWFILQTVGTNTASTEDGLGASVKFDTWQNPGQLGANYISVQGSGIPTTVVDLTRLGIFLANGAPHSVEMEHDGLTLNLWLDGLLVVTNAPMPLSAALTDSGEAWVGFGARTGAGSETHDVLAWSFTPILQEVPDSLLMNPVSQTPFLGGTVVLAARWGDPGKHVVIQGGTFQRRFHYEWSVNGNDLAYTTASTLTLTNLQPHQVGLYDVRVIEDDLIHGTFTTFTTTQLRAVATNSLAILAPLTNHLFNTAISTGGALLSVGAGDPHWRVISSSATADMPLVSSDSILGQVATNALSGWLAPSPALSPGGQSVYAYQTWFWLEPGQERSAVINGRWATVGQGMDVLLNGKSMGITNAGGAPGSAGIHPFGLRKGFVAGSNTLTLIVSNSSSTYTGVRAELEGHTTVTKGVFTGDSDGDGTSDAIELSLFGNLGQSPDDDFDGDGVSNAAERVDGTNPTDSRSFRPRLSLDRSLGYIVCEPNIESFDRGSKVVLHAVLPAGGVFNGWGGDLAGYQNPVEFTITTNMSVRANVSKPYNRFGWPVPGLVEAENFDEGGEGIGYHDFDLGDNGAALGGILLRDEGVDLTPTTFGSGGYRVGWTALGEWLNYTINVTTGGVYRVRLRSSSGLSGGSVHYEFAGNQSTLPMKVPGGSNWDAYNFTTSSVVRLEPGPQTVRLNIDVSNGFDVDAFVIEPVADVAPSILLTSPWPGQIVPVGVEVPLAVVVSDSDGTVAAVDYYVNGNRVVQTDGDSSPVLWRPPAAGEYLIHAVAIDNTGGSTASAPVTVRVEPFVRGGLKREIYANLQGALLSVLTNSPGFPDSPDHAQMVGQFESGSGWGDNYGARLSGWILPATSGDYRFYLASDDQGALFLSSDAKPANMVKIAVEPQWNGYREFIEGQNQFSRGNPPLNISTNIHLLAGRAYYVEALLKQGYGGDNLSVAWLPPGGLPVGNGANPIRSRYLAAGTALRVAPQVLGAAGLTNTSRVAVHFDHPLLLESGLRPSNYSVEGAKVTAVSVTPDPRVVLLSVTGIVGRTFDLRVSNVQDVFGNEVDANSVVTGEILPQLSSDVGVPGDPAVVGVSLPSSTGEFIVSGGGSDIWDYSDHCHFLYEPIVGDFDVHVRVGSIEAVNRWSKAALMARESLDPGSRHLSIGLHPSGPTEDGQDGGQGQNSYYASIRGAQNSMTALWGTSVRVAEAPSFPSAWLRLRREGARFTGYRSTDGTNWTEISRTNQSLPTRLMVGLATGSHNNAREFNAVAAYHNFGRLGAFPPVIVTQPLSQTLTIGSAASVTVSATGSGPLSYQWRFNGTNILNATNDTLYFQRFDERDAGNYRVVISNRYGLLNSRSAHISAVEPIVLSAELLSQGEGFRVSLSGPSGQSYRIETSTNLEDWSQVWVITNSLGVSNFLLPWLDLRYGFYRAVQLP